MILCRSKRGAKRTPENIMPFIEGKLFLKVNRDKTSISHINKVKYLGYTFFVAKGKCRLRLHKKSLSKMKLKLKELTDRSNGWSNETRILKINQFIVGWSHYYKYAEMKGVLRSVDEWLRRRIRAVYWKQWKRVKTRYKMIRKYNIPEWNVHEFANCRKGTWRAAIMLNRVLTNKEIAKLGYKTLLGYHMEICAN